MVLIVSAVNGVLDGQSVRDTNKYGYCADGGGRPS